MIKFISCLFVLLPILIFSTANTIIDQFQTINTENGPIRGQLMSTIYDAKPFYSFRGVPFAKPPINDLRFKAPVAPEQWSNVIDTFEYGSKCAQMSFFIPDLYEGEEDCLYLNVYVPVVKNMEKLPVMVWIHGGGYFSGSADGFEADFLLNNDVIVVTTNYRLGAFGFLSLGTADYSGNNGLKDQLFALQWVQRNIEEFGGDKDMVTLFGESAGSASVHWQVLTPKSNGLFKRAIMQSGSAANPWASYSKSDHLDIVYDLAKKFGKNAENVEEAIKFLKNVDTRMFIDETAPILYDVGSTQKNGEQIWAPVVEVDDAKDPILTKRPQEYLDDNSRLQTIDTMHGFCDNEMLIVQTGELLDPSMLTSFNKKFEFQFPRTDLRNNYNSKDYPKMVEEIRQFYFGNPNAIVTNETIYKFNELMSDSWFNYGIDQGVKAQLKHTTGNVFYYQFSLDTNLGIKPGYYEMLPKDVSPVTHGDELYYLFIINVPSMNLRKVYEDLPENSIERKQIMLVSKMWTDFAKYGNPTPNAEPIDFKSVQENEINFVDITNNGLISGVQPLAKRIEFWNNFYKQNKEILQQDSASN